MRVRHRALRRSRRSLQVGSLPHSRGVGVWEAGSKLTESIACELLSASSVVTHGGSQDSGGECGVGWRGGWWRRCASLLPCFCVLPSFPRVSFLKLGERKEKKHALTQNHTHIAILLFALHIRSGGGGACVHTHAPVLKLTLVGVLISQCSDAE